MSHWLVSPQEQARCTTKTQRHEGGKALLSLRVFVSSWLISLSPRVGLGRLAAGPGPDLVEPIGLLVAQLDLERAQAAGQLLERARPDDRRGHHRVAQQPGQRYVGRLLAQLAAERLVGLQLVSVLLDALLRLLTRAPPGV